MRVSTKELAAPQAIAKGREPITILNLVDVLLRHRKFCSELTSCHVAMDSELAEKIRQGVRSC